MDVPFAGLLIEDEAASSLELKRNADTWLLKEISTSVDNAAASEYELDIDWVRVANREGCLGPSQYIGMTAVGPQSGITGLSRQEIFEEPIQPNIHVNRKK